MAYIAAPGPADHLGLNAAARLQVQAPNGELIISAELADEVTARGALLTEEDQQRYTATLKGVDPALEVVCVTPSRTPGCVGCPGCPLMLAAAMPFSGVVRNGVAAAVELSMGAGCCPPVWDEPDVCARAGRALSLVWSST